MSKTKYTVSYFIDKFSRIPRDRWARNAFKNHNGERCALGHCGAENSIKEIGIALLVEPFNPEE